MKINELRIGNWVYDPDRNLLSGNGYRRVTGIDGTMILHSYGHNHSGNRIEFLKPIPLTPEILDKCGFIGDAWKSIDVLKSMVGDDGISCLTLGRTGSPDGLPYHPGIKQHTKQGFTIQQAAEIQKSQNKFDDDDAFVMNMEHSVYLKPINYLHELQNLYFALTHEELIYSHE